MSEASEIEKILSRADKLEFLGQNRAFVAVMFAIWVARKKPGWLNWLTKLAMVTGGLGGCGYLMAFFS